MTQQQLVPPTQDHGYNAVILHRPSIASPGQRSSDTALVALAFGRMRPAFLAEAQDDRALLALEPDLGIEPAVPVAAVRQRDQAGGRLAGIVIDKADDPPDSMSIG